MLSMDYGWDYFIVDESGKSYGCYDSRLQAENAIEDLYNDPFTDSDKVFHIEMQ